MAWPGCTRDVIPVDYLARCPVETKPVGVVIKMPSIHKFEIFADYFQCIVQDESSEDDFGALWTEEATGSMVAVGSSAISIGTLRNVTVSVEVHVLDREPAIVLDEFDHVVTGAFSAPTGRLMVMGCTDSFSGGATHLGGAGTSGVVSVP